MSDEMLRELAAVAALEALDGDDAEAFALAALPSAACRRELLAFRRVAELLPLALTPMAPAPELRQRVLAAALESTRPARAGAATPRRAWLGLAAAAAIACATGWSLARSERDAARLRARVAEGAAADAREDLRAAELRVAALQSRIGPGLGLQRLVSYEDARLSALSGLPAAPRARGRMLWSPSRSEAVLLASGLPPAPRGKAYEVWVIGRGAAPTPAGVFQVDPNGNAVFPLPPSTATASAQTFAVTVEPAVGVPVPTGPMVLAGPSDG